MRAIPQILISPLRMLEWDSVKLKNIKSLETFLEFGEIRQMSKITQEYTNRIKISIT
jgi:hypothetical protein